MTDVFISYKRRMRPRVEEIATKLRGMGLDVWFDAGLSPGQSFSAEISAKVRTARCVLVCWSNDAFAHGGDRNGWVIGEASIGRERGVLVPVLLERADLDPPWNTLHTESLVGWSPTSPDQAAWGRVLAGISRHVGRPLGSVADPAVVAPAAQQRRLTTPSVIIAGLAAASLSALGALLVAVVPALSGWLVPLLFAGGLALALPIAGLMLWSGTAGAARAAGLAIAILAALAAAILAASGVSSLLGAGASDVVEAVYGAVGGLVGGAVSLLAFPLFHIVPRRRSAFGRIAIASLALGLVGALASPVFALNSVSSLVWVAPLWQLAYAPLLAYVLRTRA